MPQATLINSAGQKVVVESGSQQAQNYFGQGYQLMGASGQYQPPQQPSLPQGAPQGSVAIPGAQYNTKALQQANFSNIQPVGNTLYGVPKVASSLTSDQLTGGTPNVPAATTNNQTSPDAIMAGANQYMTQLQNELAAQQAQQQALETRLTAGQTSANDLLAQIGQKGTEYQSELEKYNYTANVSQLQDVNKQIASLTAAYNQRITDNQGRPILNAIIGGQESLLRRQQAAEVGGLSAIAQALQGNITLAQNTAKDAINVKYEPMENQLKQQLQQIEFLYNDLSRADQKKADSQTALLNERLRVIEEEKATETEINNLALTAAQNPKADVNTLNAIRNAKTTDEAILIASGAMPILTPAGLAGLTENQIIRVGNKIYKKTGNNLLATAPDAGSWSLETDENGNVFKFNQTTGEMQSLTGTPINQSGADVAGADAKSIANAIKQVESGGNYNAKGASGENGAYQFMPATWESWSREYAKEALGVDTPLSMSQSNQDFVAQFKIQQWLDQGLTPQQIAAKWNSGSEIGWETKVGVNSQGVKYDVPTYVNKVINALSNQPGVSIDSGRGVNITEDGYDISRFTPQFYSTPYGQKVLNNEQQTFNAFKSEQIVKNYNDIQNKAASMQKVIDSGVGGPGDLMLVFEFMKALDPNSVVRESEYASAAKSGNIFKGAYAKFNGYLKEKGGILPEEVKKSFLDITNTKLGVLENQYNNLRSEYRRIAASQGLNPENVAPDLTVVSSQAQTSGNSELDSYLDTLSQPKSSVWNWFRGLFGGSPQPSAMEQMNNLIK